MAKKGGPFPSSGKKSVPSKATAATKRYTKANKKIAKKGK